MQMMSNATFIQRELPTPELRSYIRLQIETLCGSLIGAKHDIIMDLFKLAELFSTDDSRAKVL